MTRFDNAMLAVALLVGGSIANIAPTHIPPRFPEPVRQPQPTTPIESASAASSAAVRAG